MSITKLQQTQISGTLAGRVSDSVSNGDLLKVNRTIEDDLNSLRTQVKLIMGTSVWTDNLSGSQDLADIYAGVRVNALNGTVNLQSNAYVANGLFVSGSTTIAGDLTVNGTTTTVNTTNLEIKDAVIGLGFASGTVQQTAGDRGWIGGLAGGQNIASFWDDSAGEFVFARTTHSATGSLPIPISSYANVRAAVITGSVILATSGFSGSLTRLNSGAAYIIAGNGITINTNSLGQVEITGSATTPGAPANSVQYNGGSGNFAGSANFTFDGSNAFLTGSFSQGSNSKATGQYSIAAGGGTSAFGQYAAAFGENTIASGNDSFAGGFSTTARGDGSFAAGKSTLADNAYAFAVGDTTSASGSYSFAGGIRTVTSGSGQMAIGKYNTQNNINSFFVIGNGTSDFDRKNILAVNGLDNGVAQVILSGSMIATGSMTVTGSITSTLGFSGSLTTLANGNPYLIQGSGITITSSSNGPVTITNSSAAVNAVKGYLLGNNINVSTFTGEVNFGPFGANFGTLSTATDEYIDVHLNGVYLAYGYDITSITTTSFFLDTSISTTLTSDDIISITLRNFT
jgi:hypothetical protein